MIAGILLKPETKREQGPSNPSVRMAGWLEKRTKRRNEY